MLQVRSLTKARTAATLQVEHPVTEWISNVNIPSCQLLIGMGVPLHRIPDIRRVFCKDPNGSSPIDFDKEPQTAPSGELYRLLPGRPRRRQRELNGGIEEGALLCFEKGTTQQHCRGPLSTPLAVKVANGTEASCRPQAMSWLSG